MEREELNSQHGDVASVDGKSVGLWLKQKYIGEKNKTVPTSQGSLDAKATARKSVESRIGSHNPLLKKQQKGTKMSKTAYARGFAKVAMAYGVEPMALAKFAQVHSRAIWDEPTLSGYKGSIEHGLPAWGKKLGLGAINQAGAPGNAAKGGGGVVAPNKKSPSYMDRIDQAMGEAARISGAVSNVNTNGMSATGQKVVGGARKIQPYLNMYNMWRATQKQRRQQGQ